MKIVFLTDHSPRKKGEQFVATTREEKRTAEWYIANGIAKACECEKKGTGCADCDKKAKEKGSVDLMAKKMPEIKAIADELGIEYPAVIKKEVLVALIKEQQGENA